jgi:hypothetical protein
VASRALLLAAALLAVPVGVALPAAALIFNTNLEGIEPGQMPSPDSLLEPAGPPFNPTESQFSRDLLRYPTPQLTEKQLAITGLPPHERITLSFLLRVSDSWQGSDDLEAILGGAPERPRPPPPDEVEDRSANGRSAARRTRTSGRDWPDPVRDAVARTRDGRSLQLGGTLILLAVAVGLGGVALFRGRPRRGTQGS